MADLTDYGTYRGIWVTIDPDPDDPQGRVIRWDPRVNDGAAPTHIAIPMDYPDKYPHVMSRENQRYNRITAGGVGDHEFVEADTLVAHMSDGDVRYRVVRQPGKYDADGNPTAAVDPSTVVLWDYLAEKA